MIICKSEGFKYLGTIDKPLIMFYVADYMNGRLA